MVLYDRLLTVTNVISNDVAFCLRDNSAILRRWAFLLIIIIVSDKEGVIVSDPEPREHARFGLAGPRINNLYHLSEANRSGDYPCKPAQNGCHADGREQNPKVKCFHVYYLTKQDLQ